MHSFRIIRFGRDNETKRLDWLARYLEQLPPGLTLLDAGAGELRNKSYCTHLHYVSQDFCQYEGKGDGVALQTGIWDTTKIDIISDITAIPTPDESFDVVLCTEVLEHVPDPLSALQELGRIVRPNGQIILTAPFCSLTHFAPYHYSTGLSRYWYEKHLKDLGFEIIQANPNGGWIDYMAQELWRLPWIGKTYSNRVLGWIALLLALPLLGMLRIMNRYDRGSSELLTHGWHIAARKS